MKHNTVSKPSRRDPMQWDRNERFAEDFSVSRADTLERNDLPGACDTGDTDLFIQMDVLSSGIQGSEQRLEMIRDIALRLQQSGSIRL